MKIDELILAVADFAKEINANVGNVDWYLFGSAQNGLTDASDIDLLVVCQTHGMADAIRHLVDEDKFARPMHLSIFTRAEEQEVRFVEKQGCIQVL
jgi:predicted nucleotidyltransferase